MQSSCVRRQCGPAQSFPYGTAKILLILLSLPFLPPFCTIPSVAGAAHQWSLERAASSLPCPVYLCWTPFYVCMLTRARHPLYCWTGAHQHVQVCNLWVGLQVCIRVCVNYLRTHTRTHIHHPSRLWVGGLGGPSQRRCWLWRGDAGCVSSARGCSRSYTYTLRFQATLAVVACYVRTLPTLTYAHFIHAPL